MSEYKPITEEYDVAVVGAGHAGCEAALACARLGLNTVVFTVSVESIALMPCNPNIGGSSKGHLVREIDALGGEMGKNIDRTFIQSKMLNISKGPAVHSLRAQADKAAYTMSMRKTLENQKNLTIVQQETSGILAEIVSESTKTPESRINSGLFEGETVQKTADEKNFRITGIRMVSGAVYHAKAVILCTGVYLKARCIYGDVSQYTGPNGLMAANHLSQSLLDLGIRLVRFKTGTPARIDGRTIDYEKMAIQPGDETVVPFSFSTDPKDVQIEQVPCWLTYTNEKTHEIIRENIDRSPLYSGAIHATGPRYCPSIEDKVVKFAEKDRHQVFIEPEGRYTHEMYVDGMSSSMPEDVQHAMYHSVPGLEHAKIVRNAYAIEYDCLAPGQLKNTLEFRRFSGLFSAGQFNGSSGYEEAAAQGFVAGVNAALKILGREPMILDRASSYIGTLVDDLITKGTEEPYRMMTSRSEYRLVLRQDNADERLTPIGRGIGLISDERWQRFLTKEAQKKEELSRAEKTVLPPSQKLNDLLVSHETTPVSSGVRLADLIRRPELNYEILKPVDSGRPDFPDAVFENAEIELKYAGYIKRQKAQIAEMRRLEDRRLPDGIDYGKIVGLRREAQEKLQNIRPRSLGQASRISGVSPADLSVLLIWLSRGKGKAV